ncbi:TspO/MBR family protein [Halalkalibacter nanhaiisediminis]|uniref:TspO/MBR related protein n=1 Tax=Halalkalibacter nanhaiisediminis TaxID=688079 RepID=A0A562QHC1_9BACI|nr:tryptophan-rich sensory protein [Halalkalibacter nanhaiisediminis]TWI56158.1 TspO/MBR related protein [Halalkalibacter nanhaiisediminis]
MRSIWSSILVFVITYSLFSLAGVLFPIDPDWYNSLHKPKWTPSGSMIGLIWALLFFLIATAVAKIYRQYGFTFAARLFWFVLLANWLLNQAFSYFLFTEKNLFFAFVDSAFVTLTTFLLIITTKPLSKKASNLLIPYLLWSSFATYLAFIIYIMNK